MRGFDARLISRTPANLLFTRYNTHVIMLRLLSTTSLGCLLLASLSASLAHCQDAPQTNPIAPQTSPSKSRQPVSSGPSGEQLDLEKAIAESANDRAALLRNLEAFLKKYPESSQRPQIYRALVEASMQLRDYPRAVDYAERLVSLKPDDISNTVLTIQLLDRYGDVAGWRRAVFYCSRVMETVQNTSQHEKSPRVSPEDWQAQKNRDRASLLLERAGLYQKLNDLADAQKDMEASYALIPSAAAAMRLGELAELNKNPNDAILEYARAFALTDGASGATSRAEIRKKIGNVWRLAHGSEDGLGDYLLHTFDAVTQSAAPAQQARNQGVKELYDFILRKAPEGSSYPLAATKGKILVLNFWATWCGPCREMAPHFEKVATHFAEQKDVLFVAVNGDDDENLVPPYLEAEKPKINVVYGDGLDRLLRVESFPTTVIIDRTGQIAYRSDGFDPDTVEKTLTDAVARVLQPASAPPAAARATP